MYNRRSQTEAKLRAAERRKREDDAPRLKNEVPRLVELKLELHEVLGESSVSAAKHIRHVVVDHAPALFDVPCTDSACQDGGHDLTSEMLRSLRSGATEFTGEDSCHGRLGATSTPCRRVLHYTAFAKYRD
jgi:hypothetical protein